MKSVYQNSIFSKVVNPHLFIDFAFLYLNGMEQNKIEEALNLGHGRGVEWKRIIQELTEEHNKMITVQLGSMFGGARKYGRGTYNNTHIHIHKNKRANTHTLTQTRTLSQSRLVCR
jgi:UDP-glucose 4-epimerase